MAFFLGLISISLFLFLLAIVFKWNRLNKFWVVARYATTIMFVQVGVMHLVNPDAFIYMIDAFLPYPKALIYLSGITEIVLGLGLLWHRTRAWSARLLIIQLFAMFPANIYVAVNHLSPPGGLPAEDWYTWSRLFFQPIYMLWVYKVGGLRIKNNNNASFFSFLRQ